MSVYKNPAENCAILYNLFKRYNSKRFEGTETHTPKEHVVLAYANICKCLSKSFKLSPYANVKIWYYPMVSHVRVYYVLGFEYVFIDKSFGRISSIELESNELMIHVGKYTFGVKYSDLDELSEMIDEEMGDTDFTTSKKPFIEW